MFFVNREVVPLLYVVGAPTSARGVYNENFYAGFVCSCMIPDWPNFQNAKCRLVVLVLVQFEKKDYHSGIYFLENCEIITANDNHSFWYL
jgi:hypothetical protein